MGGEEQELHFPWRRHKVMTTELASGFGEGERERGGGRAAASPEGRQGAPAAGGKAS